MSRTIRSIDVLSYITEQRYRRRLSRNMLVRHYKDSVRYYCSDNSTVKSCGKGCSWCSGNRQNKFKYHTDRDSTQYSLRMCQDTY